MNEKVSMNMRDLLELFEPHLTAEDLLEAKLMSRVAVSITKERLRLNMSQTEFAKHLGVGQSMVSRWETGDYNFTLKTIAKVAAKLGLDVDIELSNNEAPVITHEMPHGTRSEASNVFYFDEYAKKGFRSTNYYGGGWKNVKIR